MKIIRYRILAVVLALALLLSGCSLEALEAMVEHLYAPSVVHYSQMEYSRPDMDALEATLEESCALLEKTMIPNQAIGAINSFYEEYDRFYTAYNLANIRYSGNLADIGWEEEYNFCMENVAVADAALDELYSTIAAAPIRQKLEELYFGEGFFESYDGESIWDDTFLALMEQEAQLQNAYYALSNEALDSEFYSEEYFSLYGTQMAELFVELVALRQQIAEYAGYESYPQFAYDFYYYRDYTPEQAESYLQQIGHTLYDTYYGSDLSHILKNASAYCSEEDTFAYVKETATAVGGVPAEAFSLLEAAGLYDIAYGENKYDSSFEIYLWSYYEPFIFMNPYLKQLDKLTFAHEFGHFCNDYVCGGSYAGADVAEVHSQAFEYLSLCYAEDTGALTEYKLADSLCVYMEQAAFALFEHQVYSLTGEALTVENVEALYEKIGLQFGMDSRDWDSRDYVTITHYYTHPMYVVSYVLSNDLAMQIYEMELQEPGSGLSLYENCLESQDTGIITFAETYGLESPFAPGRLEKAAALFVEYLK